MIEISTIKDRLLRSKLFKDSFWAVFGNGLGNALLLLAGIIIARFLGKDVYGEYGLVKSTMFYISGFATFGLGFSATKYVAQYLSQDKTQIKSIIKSAILITSVFSGFITLLLFIFAEELANFLDEPTLAIAFKFLGIIVFFKSLNTTEAGIMAGYGNFKQLAFNNVATGALMLILAIVLTYYFGLKGSLAALAASQVFSAFVNGVSIYKRNKTLPSQSKVSYVKSLVSFSFPLALQESSYTICNWGGILVLTKLSTLGEVGLYTAAAQWNAIILFLPGLLKNVVLSHLSFANNDVAKHRNTVKTMLIVNFVCTLIPFVVVYILADWIVSFYGETFKEMTTILRVYTFITIPSCCAEVLKSEFISLGRNWLMFTIRFFRDVSLLVFAYIFISYSNGVNGALYYALAYMTAIIIYISCLVIFYIRQTKQLAKE